MTKNALSLVSPWSPCIYPSNHERLRNHVASFTTNRSRSLQTTLMGQNWNLPTLGSRLPVQSIPARTEAWTTFLWPWPCANPCHSRGVGRQPFTEAHGQIGKKSAGLAG